jgi:hypothetical protein
MNEDVEIISVFGRRRSDLFIIRRDGVRRTFLFIISSNFFKVLNVRFEVGSDVFR